MKTTVRQIINGETPTDKKSLFSLTEHGFVIKEKDQYKMRVPIFEQWVIRFGEVV
jgi:predicted transcriptional regulator